MSDMTSFGTPAAPPWISVPSTVFIGDVLTVEWGKSVDDDGSFRYELEYSLDNEPFYSIYNNEPFRFEFSTECRLNGCVAVFRIKVYNSDWIESEYTVSNECIMFERPEPDESIWEKPSVRRLRELNVGDRIEVPVEPLYRSRFGDKIVFRIAAKNHQGYPPDCVTLITNRVIQFMCFDAAEPSNPNTVRSYNGNNRYAHSNIHQWLNSGTDEWYAPQHTKDEPPTEQNISFWGDMGKGYETWHGFLLSFSHEFAEALLETSLTVRNCDADGGIDTLSAKVFLASTAELGLEVSDTEIPFELAQTENLCQAFITSECLSEEAREWDIGTTYTWEWWTRTPTSDDDASVFAAHSEYQIFQSAFIGVMGLRPLCNLPDTVTVFGDNGYYKIAFDAVPDAEDTEPDEPPVEPPVEPPAEPPATIDTACVITKGGVLENLFSSPPPAPIDYTGLNIRYISCTFTPSELKPITLWAENSLTPLYFETQQKYDKLELNFALKPADLEKLSFLTQSLLHCFVRPDCSFAVGKAFDCTLTDNILTKVTNNLYTIKYKFDAIVYGNLITEILTTETSGITVCGTKQTEAVITFENKTENLMPSVSLNDYTVENLGAGDVFVIDGVKKLVTSNGVNAWQRVDFINFPRLNAGHNPITITGNASVSITYAERW